MNQAHLVKYEKLKQCHQCDNKLTDLPSDNDDNYRGWCSGCHIVWLLPRPQFQIEMTSQTPDEADGH